ncbi:hypothetical protein BSPA111_37730 [Buttiauxella sp. A111]|nr:hypothetical protein BSPA111_37730 [Buttiauxella sp. A111]
MGEVKSGMPDKRKVRSRGNGEAMKGKPTGQQQDLMRLPLDELRFFGVEPRDAGRGFDEVTYGDIADNYTFTCFNKRSSEQNDGQKNKDYDPINFWQTLLIKDIEKEERSRKERRTQSQSFSSSRNASNDISFAKKKNADRWTYPFRHPLQKDDRRVVKTLLNDKKRLFADLQQHYFSLQRNSRSDKKTLTLLPMSIFLSQEGSQHNGSAHQRMKEHVARLNKLLPQVIRKLRHRSPYSSFLGYSKVVMLTDTYFVPFLHIIFYLTEDNLSTWYAHDIGSTLGKVSGCHVDIHYYSFAGELPSPPKHLLNAEMVDGGSGSYQIVYKDVLLPFPSEDPNKYRGIEEKTVAELTALIARAEMKKINKERYSQTHLKALKQQLKNITGMDDSQKNHLSYLARVAKNYSKIPGVTSVTQSDKPVYNNQYSRHKYEQRKLRKKMEQELQNDTAMPSNYGEHIASISKG